MIAETSAYLVPQAEEATRSDHERTAEAERALNQAKEELQSLARDCNRLERARTQMYADMQQAAKEHSERVQVHPRPLQPPPGRHTPELCPWRLPNSLPPTPWLNHPLSPAHRHHPGP